MVITLARGRAERGPGVIEWGHTLAHTHTRTVGTAMATKLHCKYAQNDRSDRVEDCAGAGAECGDGQRVGQDGPSRLWAKQSHKVENYI